MLKITSCARALDFRGNIIQRNKFLARAILMMYRCQTYPFGIRQYCAPSSPVLISNANANAHAAASALQLSSLEVSLKVTAPLHPRFPEPYYLPRRQADQYIQWRESY